MHPIFRYTTMMIILILTSIYVVDTPSRSDDRPQNTTSIQSPKLAQEDARRDVGLGADLRWFAYGTGCWMFAVVPCECK